MDSDSALGSRFPQHTIGPREGHHLLAISFAETDETYTTAVDPTPSELQFDQLTRSKLLGCSLSPTPESPKTLCSTLKIASRTAGLEAVIPVTDRLRDYWAAKMAGCSAAVAGAMTHGDNGEHCPGGPGSNSGHVELAVRFRHRSVSLLGPGFQGSGVVGRLDRRLGTVVNSRSGWPS
jgi:hypothetical protein